MRDDVGEWASKRAPELVARAEAEAVEELKRALLEAAAGKRRPEPTRTAPPAPEPAVAQPPAAEPEGEGLWAYCVARAGDPLPEKLNGVHDGAALERIEDGDLTVLVSRVPLAEFAEEPLRRNLNDFEWLERVARRHEAVLEGALQGATIVPLRLCTIYADEQGAARMLDEERSALLTALEALAGREEWGVKLLVDRDALESAARARSTEAAALEEEMDARTGGGAYMLKRRLDRHLREVADSLADELADDVHARLQDWASDAVLNRPQNRDLSRHEGEMLLNAAYLVETAKVERLHELVAELETRHGELGARLELTGPWPPYNFVPGSGRALA